MSERNFVIDRLDYHGDLAPIIDQVCEVYSLGKLQGFSVIPTGYEDCNILVTVEQRRFIIKIFAKFRTASDINRYVSIIEQVIGAGIEHPQLVKTSNGTSTYSDNRLTLAVFHFIEGATFYELGRAPSTCELGMILEQAAKVNAIDYTPAYLYDSWAIPNIRTTYNKVHRFVDAHDAQLVDQVLSHYEAIPVTELPHALVHGDIIKTNVIKGDDEKIYVIDFSVANRYPRIQELAVIAGSLLHDDNGPRLAERCEQVAEEYSQFTPLTAAEHHHLYAYALAGIAMEFLGAHQEKYLHDLDNEETNYWLQTGRAGLQRELT